MYPGSLENGIWYLNIAAAVVLIARLYFQGLAGVYRLLFLYLVVGVLQSMLALVLASNSPWTRVVYSTGQMLKVAAAIFIPMELFRLALVQQPALARFGRSMIGYFFAVAAILAALNVLFGASAAKYNTWVGRLFAFERSMDLVVMLVLLLMSVFLLWFPVRTRKNTAVCIGGFAVYSFERWTGLLSVDLWPDYTRQFSTAMQIVSSACLMTWIILLRRDRETATVVTGHGWDPRGSRAPQVSIRRDQRQAGALGAHECRPCRLNIRFAHSHFARTDLHTA